MNFIYAACMFGLVEHIKSEYLSGMFWGQTHVATQKKKKKFIIFNLDAHVTALSLCNFIRCFPQKRSKWCTFGKTKLDWVVHLLVYGPGTSDFDMGIINLCSSYWWSLDGSLDPLIKRWIFSPNKPLPSLCCCFWRERERGGWGIPTGYGPPWASLIAFLNFKDLFSTWSECF